MNIEHNHLSITIFFFILPIKFFLQFFTANKTEFILFSVLWKMKRIKKAFELWWMINEWDVLYWYVAFDISKCNTLQHWANIWVLRIKFIQIFSCKREKFFSFPNNEIFFIVLKYWELNGKWEEKLMDDLSVFYENSNDFVKF